MTILGWILFGFVVGLLARALKPGNDPMGWGGTTVLGIAGALAGGWLGEAAGWYAPNEGAGFLTATLGAVLILGIYHLFTRRRSRGQPFVDADPSTGSVSDSNHWRDAA